MLLAVLLPLLIHVLWLHFAYIHTRPDITKRVRALAALASLVLSTASACLLVEYGRAALSADKPAACASDSCDMVHMIKMLGGPENYLRYLEIVKPRDLP